MADRHAPAPPGLGPANTGVPSLPTSEAELDAAVREQVLARRAERISAGAAQAAIEREGAIRPESGPERRVDPGGSQEVWAEPDSVWVLWGPGCAMRVYEDEERGRQDLELLQRAQAQSYLELTEVPYVPDGALFEREDQVTAAEINAMRTASLGLPPTKPLGEPLSLPK